MFFFSPELQKEFTPFNNTYLVTQSLLVVIFQNQTFSVLLTVQFIDSVNILPHWDAGFRESMCFTFLREYP